MNKITEIWINGKQIRIPTEATIEDVIEQLGIERGALKNVQSDWNATTGDSVILNKPHIPKEINESDISNWGFGKIKNIKVNGLTLTPKNGTLNLGELDVIQVENIITDEYQISDKEDDNLAISPNDTYEEAFGKIEKNVLDNELVTTVALVDLDERIKEINEKSEEAFDKIEKNVLDNELVVAAALVDLDKRIKEINEKLENGDFVPGGGSGGTIARRLDKPIYYLLSNSSLNNIPSNWETFTSSNISITEVLLNTIYFYVAIPTDYTMKIVTENNEDITDNFNPRSTSAEYKLFEFHLDSNLPLDANVTINIIL